MSTNPRKSYAAVVVEDDSRGNEIVLGTADKITLSEVMIDLAGCIPCDQGVWVHGTSECDTVTFREELTTTGMAALVDHYIEEDGTIMTRRLIVQQYA